MGRIIISLLLQIMMISFPLDACVIVDDHNDLVHNMTDALIATTDFKTGELNDYACELGGMDLVVLGAPYMNLENFRIIQDQLSQEALLLVYWVGGMDQASTCEKIQEWFSNHQVFCLGVNEDEISESRWLQERFEKTLLQIYAYHLR